MKKLVKFILVFSSFDTALIVRNRRWEIKLDPGTSQLTVDARG